MIDNSNNYYIGVRFVENPKAYYFSTSDETLKSGDHVIVESLRGIELVSVLSNAQHISEYKSNLDLKPIIRRATKEDLFLHEANIKLAKEALKLCESAIKDLNLDMRLLFAQYTLDGTKITITYVADGRVDFRELLKVLAAKLRCRIELRQIGLRDKAKIVGGIGVCGLPLCCSTFLQNFEIISINHAKNQMLTLNIPKLSGQCGKLVCCLLFEDEQYSELKRNFPAIGDEYIIGGETYKVTSYNVLSRTLRLD
ncbi:MAG: regulatory iron-sulfur-containing complex subunit RicT [Bacilli bacterium]